MRRALALAEAGWGRVHPNPLVGAVVVRDGRIVGEGAHREFGGAHAEVEALATAGERARGATLYVTLEPCAHQGKTPPCTDAITAAGIRRLVYAVPDPHPDARGGGELLEAHGLAVTRGVEEERARSQNALFLRPLERHRPFVALKYGMTLDARLGVEGRTTRVTGREAQEAVHRLRSGFDAVLVGGRTARVDDPLLTVRHAPPPRTPPTRVVVDSAAALSPDSALARSAREVPVWVVVAAGAERRQVDALETLGVRVVTVSAGEGGVDLDRAVRRLGELGLRTIFCEGGGRLGAALLRADLVDRLYLFIAPRLLGDGVPAFPGTFSGAEGPATFRFADVRITGEDALVTLDRST